MGRKSLILLTLALFATLEIIAQGPSTFEFVENKGQWDTRVKFKGEIPTGDFYLQQKGFTIIQHNSDDLNKFFRHQHGSPATGNNGNRKGSKVDNNDHVIDDGHGEGGGGSGGKKNFVIRSHAYRVEFFGANENPVILPDKALTTYNNYFIGDDPSKWAAGVRIFQAVVYKNVYPNIDVRYYSEYGRLKYDIIVNPGGDVTKVMMRYEGVDKLSIKNNELIIKTSVAEVKELYPYSYQFDKVTGRKEVITKYELTDKNTVRFNVGNYSKNSTLIIDPTLVFSSYTGSRAGEYGFTATPGPDGSLYAGSIVFGSGFITTTGAYQSNFQGGTTNGGTDIGITKFSPLGNVRSYATYIGGKNANEYPHSLICDPQGQLIIMGRTYADDYPTFPAGNVQGNGGSGDVVVTKLNAAGGGLIGSMRIGGTGADGSNIKDMQEGASLSPAATLRFYGDDSRSEVTLDAGGNIYVAAQSRPGSDNTKDFPIRGGGFQPTRGGGQDGVIMKIDPNCQNIIWSSYLGGSGDDGAFVISVNPANNDIYVGGATVSPNFPGIKPGAYQTGFQGGQADGFVARIANNGSAIIQASYMGTGSYDAVYGVKFDNSGIPYIMGISEGGWKAVNATYQNAGSSQFIAKLRPDLSGFIYTTVFGTGNSRPNISPVAFLVDRCENVYISGWGGWIQRSANDPFNMSGTLNMPTTSDAIKTSSDNMDFYFFVLKKDAASQLYGSFFGQSGGEGEHVDGGTSRFDASGVIYQAICANCFGNQAGNITVPFPIKPGVIGPQNGTGTDNCNLAAVKIAFNFAGVGAGPRPYFNGLVDSLGCVPFTVTLRDTIRNAKRYEWNFGDGSPDTSTTNFELQHTFNAVGNYRVRLIAIDSTTCNIRDTAYLTIRVRDDQASVAMLATKLPPCESLTYRFDNLSTAPPGKPFTNTSFTWDLGDGTLIPPTGTSSLTHTYTAAGTYIVKLTLIDTNYCNAPEELIDTLRISPLVDARFETPPFGCVPYDAVFNNTSLAGQQFRWDFGDGSTSTETNPVHTYPNTGTYTIKLVAIDSSTCNIIDSTSYTITVSEKPTAEFNTTPVPALENTPTVFHNLSLGGNRYKWLFGDGDSVVTTKMDTVMHQYNATGTYEACLITYNQYDCTDTACHPVQAVIVPLLDVPNAFTPGRFGRNSIVRVEGFGIAKMTWKIYNRWGQVVFETNNRKVGWDGTFKGQIQPMDVYAYVLDVQFSDGTTTRKTGDITLIR